MRFILFALMALFTFINCTEKNRSFSQSEIAILPKPVSLDLHEASFAVKDEQTIFANLVEQQTAASELQKFITKSSGFKITVNESNKASISFENL
jgi:hexosaminidase